MPPKQCPTPSTPQKTATKGTSSSSRAGIRIFLQKLGKQMSDTQQILTEYPNYEEHFQDHEASQARQNEMIKSLEAKEEQIKQLEAAVAIFEGVHMNTSKALKEENFRLNERIRETEEQLLRAEEQSKASRNVFVKEFEKLIKDKNHELEQALRDHGAALEKQKKWLEEQHSEIMEKSFLQLNKVSRELQEQNAELEKLDLMNDGLKKKLAQSNNKLREIQQELFNVSDDLFQKEWRELANDFHTFCKVRFSSLPQGTTAEDIASQQQDIKEKLLRAGFTDRIPFFIPTGNIEASRLLRLAGVEHIVSETLCKNIFQPIILHNCSHATGTFQTISQQLHLESPLKEAIWRTATVCALAESNNIDSKARQMIGDVLKLTDSLIRDEDREIVVKELMELFGRAFRIWEPAQKNSARIFATTTLTDDTLQAWESHSEQDEFVGSSEDEMAEIDPHGKVLCLFPRIYRERSFTADKGSEEDKGYVYFPGTALYADAGAYIVGERERREFKKLVEELSKKAQMTSADSTRASSRRSRRLSISTLSQLPQPPPHAQSFSERAKNSQIPSGRSSLPTASSVKITTK